MLKSLITTFSSFVWTYQNYLVSITLFIATIVLLSMPPKRKASSTGTTRTTSNVKTKRVKTQAIHYAGSASSGPSQIQQQIRKIFDSYRDSAVDEPDKIGIDGIIKYFEVLDVGLEDVSSVAVFDLVDAPAMGEFSRDGFVTGWSNVSSPANPCDTTDRQKVYVKTMLQKLESDPSYFRQVYKASFRYAKPENQRAVPMDTAFAFWDMFFGGSKGGINWSSPNTNWYALWKEYYSEKNKRPINKDLWNQTMELVNKTREPGGESLDWWSEDGAWPTAVDDFVAFVKAKRATGAAGGMDTS